MMCWWFQIDLQRLYSWYMFRIVQEFSGQLKPPTQPSMNQVEKFIEILHARTHAKQCWNVGMMGSIGCSQPGMMPIHQEFSSNVLLLKGFRSPSTDDDGTSIDIIDYLLQAKPRTFAQKKHQLQEPPAGGWSAKPQNVWKITWNRLQRFVNMC